MFWENREFTKGEKRYKYGIKKGERKNPILLDWVSIRGIIMNSWLLKLFPSSVHWEDLKAISPQSHEHTWHPGLVFSTFPKPFRKMLNCQVSLEHLAVLGIKKVLKIGETIWLLQKNRPALFKSVNIINEKQNKTKKTGNLSYIKDH